MADRQVSVVINGKEYVSAEFARAEGAARKFETGITSLTGSLGIVQTALGAMALGAVARQLMDAGIAADKMRNSLIAATGSATQAAAEMAFIRSEAARLGLDLVSSAEAYAKLSAAARGTALEGEGARKIFTAVSEASTTMGLSAEETSGALTAIQQMMSKGTVSAEELRGQLGERLPGAFNVAAAAMGVTTAELGEMLKKGQVAAEDFLPRFADQLVTTFGASERATHSAQAEINRFHTAVFDLKLLIMDQGGSDALKELAQGATFVVNSMRPAIRTVAEWKATLESTFVDVPAALMAGNPLTREGRAEIKAALDAANALYEWNMNNMERRFAPAPTTVPPPGPPGKGGGGGGSSGGAAAKPTASSAATAQVREFFGSVWDMNEIELAAERIGVTFGDALRKKTAVTITENGGLWSLVTNSGGSPDSLLGNVDLMNRPGPREMSPAEQSQFDQTAMLRKWESANSDSFDYQVTMTEEFYAMRDEVASNGLSTSLLRLQQEEDAWIRSWAMQTDSFEEHERRKAEIAEVYAQKRRLLEGTTLQQLQSGAASSAAIVTNTMEALASMTGKKSREMFEIAKIANISRALIDTYALTVAAAKDTPGPLPVRALAAAAALTFGLAQVAAISSQEFDGGGTASGGGVNTGAIYTTGQGMASGSNAIVSTPTTAPQQSQQLTIVLNNPIGERQWFETNLPAILKEFGDRKVDAGIVYA